MLSFYEASAKDKELVTNPEPQLRQVLERKTLMFAREDQHLFRSPSSVSPLGH